jgi:hypothetical protein
MNLLLSIVFFILTFLFLKYHKNWLSEKQKNGSFDSYDKYTSVYKNWFLIILSGILSIIFLLKSFIE